MQLCSLLAHGPAKLAKRVLSGLNETAWDTARTLASTGLHPFPGRGSVVGYTLFGEFYDELTEEGNVFVYLLAHRTPGRNEDFYWAWHSSELWYTFGSLRDVEGQRDWEEWDYELADIMTSYWVNFMANGDPNGEGLAQWLPANSEQLAYVYLGEEDTLTCVTDFGALTDLEIEYNKAALGL